MQRTVREPNAHVEFEASDFELSPQVSSEAERTTIFGLDFFRLFKAEHGTISRKSMPGMTMSLPVIGGNWINPTQGYAIHSLLKENPGYDVVFYPQFETTSVCPVFGLCFIQESTKVEVKARLGKLK